MVGTSRALCVFAKKNWCFLGTIPAIPYHQNNNVNHSHNYVTFFGTHNVNFVSVNLK